MTTATTMVAMVASPEAGVALRRSSYCTPPYTGVALRRSLCTAKKSFVLRAFWNNHPSVERAPHAADGCHDAPAANVCGSALALPVRHFIAVHTPRQTFLLVVILCLEWMLKQSRIVLADLIPEVFQASHAKSTVKFFSAMSPHLMKKILQRVACMC